MTTIEEGKLPIEIDEDDELDGWGPVRARRSSVQVCAVAMAGAPTAAAERQARDADEAARASETPPTGEPPHPISCKLLV
jgi:hypothetical protein